VLAAGALAGGLFDERCAAWSTAILSMDDDRAMSLLDAGAAASVAVGPAAPVTHNAVHWPCSIHTAFIHGGHVYKACIYFIKPVLK